MQQWFTCKNTQAMRLNEIPQLSVREWHTAIVRECQAHKRPVLLFGREEAGQLTLYAVLADDGQSQLAINATPLGPDRLYFSLTPEVPAFHLFERELHEEFGVIPDGHPWLKPVRYSFNRADPQQAMTNYPFFTMTGAEVHEVAVGPVHAGVIEPGHFRFMCQGETVYHLEIQLGYQHRGLEQLFVQRPGAQPHLAESIAGDTVIGHATAYAQALEALGGCAISQKAQAIRAIALELERIAVHIGDLGALANDVAYMMGPSVFGAIRTLVINTTQEICGNRFGHGLIRVGGCLFDLPPALRDTMRTTLNKVEYDVKLMAELMFDAPSVLERFEHTGTVTPEEAAQIGLVGPAGRASGQARDVRIDHPFGIYRNSPLARLTLDNGDVFARAMIRYQEIQQSLTFIKQQLARFPEQGDLLTPVHPLPPDSLTVSLVEGWRGEIAHAAITDSQGQICRYKIKDPSFHNWFGLALSVRNNGISDFPLCNKSFNLSYCGFDL